MDIVQGIRQTVADGMARLRETISAVTLTDTPGIVREAVSGHQDALAELRLRWADDPEGAATAILKVIRPMIEGPAAKAKPASGADSWHCAQAHGEFDVPLAKHLLRAALRQQARRAQPAPLLVADGRQIVKLATGQPVHIQATTLAAIGVPLRWENVTELRDDPDDPDGVIEGPAKYQPMYANVGTEQKPEMIPIYDLPAFPLGFSPIYDRHRTLAIVGESGELVDVGVPNPYAASSHFTHHKGDPPGYLRWAKHHRKYNADKWNSMFKKWLATLSADCEIGRRLDDLAVMVINGVRIAIITHEYAGHGQQVVDEVLRRARAGVVAKIADDPHRTGQQAVGFTPSHWLDDPAPPQPGVKYIPETFDWRAVVRIGDATAYPLELSADYLLAITGEGKLIETTPNAAVPVYGQWETVLDSDTGQECQIWRHKRPVEANDLWLLWQPLLNDWYADKIGELAYSAQQDAIERNMPMFAWLYPVSYDRADPHNVLRDPAGLYGATTANGSQRSLKRTIQAPTHGTITAYPAIYQGHYVPASDREALAGKIKAKIDVEERNARQDGRKPIHDPGDLAYLAKITFEQPAIRTTVYEANGGAGRFDDHDAILEPSAVEQAGHLAALVHGDDEAADLISGGFDAEAAAEILKIGGRPRRRGTKTEALDRILSKTYAGQDAQIAYRQDAERNMLWNDWRKGKLTEADLERYALLQGYRDIRITCDPGLVADDELRQQLIEAGAQTVVKMHSAVAQLMGKPPVIVEIDGQVLNEAQQKAVNKGRRYVPAQVENGHWAPAWDVTSERPKMETRPKATPWAPRQRKSTKKGKKAVKAAIRAAKTAKPVAPKAATRPVKTYPTYWEDLAAGRVPVPVA